MYKHEHNNATIYVVNTSHITYCFTYLLASEFKFSDATHFFFLQNDTFSPASTMRHVNAFHCLILFRTV